MKKYDELTHEELVALDEEGIELLVELEIAHEGILPAPKAELPTLEDAGIVQDDTVYEVAGLLFKNEEDAAIVAALPILIEDYDWYTGYEYKWVKPRTDRTVSQKAYYRQEDVVRVKDALQRNKAKESEYEPKKKAYDEFLKLSGEVRNRVWGHIASAQEHQREIELAKKTLEKHLELAENDESIAYKFFRDAYKERPDIIEAILGKGLQPADVV